MRHHIGAGLALALAIGTPAMAASVFDGAWKIDLGATQMPKKPDAFLLKDGMFRCESCSPAFTIKADGKPQPVSGHDYYDAASIKVIDARTVDWATYKGGKQLTVNKNMVSADGKTLTISFEDMSSGKMVTGKGIDTRLTAAPAGAHAMSGTWKQAPLSDLSANALIVNFKSDGKTLSMSQASGVSYDAVIGGPPVPVKGDPAGTMAAVKQTGPNSFIETDTRKGKTVSTMDISVAGKTMTAVFKDLVQNTTTSYKAIKQ